MNGIDASRMIKGGGRLQNIPRIVMVTAFGSEDVRAQAEEIGMDGYLSKPVNASLLYDTLMRLFGADGEEAGASYIPRCEAPEYDATGIRLLLVEDNETNQQVARELLESAGAVVTIAQHGGEAVRMLREGPEAPAFDAILMDLQMPEMDGYTAARLLREDRRFRQIPIIAMTAHAMVEERQRCLEAGMNDHVSKPIEPEALFATLKRWVRARPAGETPDRVKPAQDGDGGQLQIEGVDVAGALRRVAGNQKLYRSLLEQFAARQADAGSQIAAALRGGDEALAERIAHTVKGVAGNLGIQAVQSAAASVEQQIHNGGGSALGLTQELEAALGRAVQTIRRELLRTSPATGAIASPRESDPQAAAAAITRLRGLIEANDGDAVDAFPAAESALGGIADQSGIDALRSALEDFDFDRARSKLEEITAGKL